MATRLAKKLPTVVLPLMAHVFVCAIEVCAGSEGGELPLYNLNKFSIDVFSSVVGGMKQTGRKVHQKERLHLGSNA